MEGGLWRKTNATNPLKVRIGGFRRAPMPLSGLNTPDFIGRTNPVMTEELGPYVEEETGKLLVQSDLSPSIRCKTPWKDFLGKMK